MNWLRVRYVCLAVIGLLVGGATTSAQEMVVNPLQIQDLLTLASDLSVTDLGTLDAIDINRLRAGAIERNMVVTTYDQFPAIELDSFIVPSEGTADQFREAFGKSSSQIPTQSLGSFQEAFPDVVGNAPFPWVQTAIDPVALASFQENAAQIAMEQVPTSSNLRILVGQPVVHPDVYLDAVMLFGQTEDFRPAVCSGVLLSPQLVLTAAHCACPGNLRTALVGTSFWSAPQLINLNEASMQTALDCAIFNDPFDYAARVGEGDLAVYRLETPAQGVQTRRIATENMITQAASVRAVGFGKTTAGESSDLRGKFVVDIVIASADCTDVESLFPNTGYRCRATNEMVAAGAGRDTCGGDSGGPIYVLGFDLQLYLAGITSRSVDPNGACGPGGIYVKLSDEGMRQRLSELGVPADIFVPN